VPSNRIYASVIPLGTSLPAIAYMLISTVEETSVGLTTNRLRSRIQITVAAKTYLSTKQIVNLVITACNHQRGTFNGVQVDSVIRDVVGADFRDDDEDIFYSTVDFRIAHGN
jgi:hypothetical protein